MGPVKPPNHSTTVMCIFESTDRCNRVNGDQPNDFEVMLSTNTAISNCLESGKFYLMIGQLITTTNGNPPVITYNQNSANPVQSPQGAQLDMINKVGLVGLGHVISSAEVVAGGTEDAVCLEVIVAHNDWNPQSFQMK
ncbi:hypothetical protein PCANC_27306 [Puccinia coronata f. sp. avenae]|uniref:Uncharacterized protein n=1 Tax=Puccinia coronata f. sp. avenae TaxID=200324 RepID=A0A2N5SC63_9BASI|nr:hypothetical protein PCANC_27306 [Puccinia coronata f. sp. avenae]